MFLKLYAKFCSLESKYNIDIGDYGSNAYGAISTRSAFGQALLDGELDFPGPKELPNYPEGGVLPHCIVADETFPLRHDIMRPYPRGNRQIKLTRQEQIFNYRLSRARRIVENGFGFWSKSSGYLTENCH